MRDIRTPEGGERSIRNISITSRKVAKRVSEEPELEEEEDGEYIPPVVPHRSRHRLPRHFWLYALLVSVVAISLALLASFFFSGTTVTLTVRTEVVDAPASLEAAANGAAGTLTYKSITSTRSASVTVNAQGVQKVSRAASGLLTIQNAYSKDSQPLIANTRFEAADGKIYRIRESVTVPGMQGSTPGTVSTMVFADSPGPDYNKPTNTTFSIPGFKGKPQYTTFTAKAEGGVTGGFIGDEPAVAAADLAAAKTSLQQKLDTEVRAAATTVVPEGYMPIAGSLTVSFAPLSQAPGEGNKATLTQQATATGLIVRSNDLASALARSGGVDRYQGEAVQLVDASKLEMGVATTTPDGGPITLITRGQATIQWAFDQNALLEALAGKSKDQFGEIVDAFRPAIVSAKLNIKPVWQNTLPADPASIKVQIKTSN